MAMMNKRQRKKALKRDLRKLPDLLDKMAQGHRTAAEQIDEREVASYLMENKYYIDKLAIMHEKAGEMEARKCI